MEADKPKRKIKFSRQKQREVRRNNIRYFIGPDGKRYKGARRRYESPLNREGIHTGKSAYYMYPPDIRENPRGIEMVGAIENPDTPTESWLGTTLNDWIRKMKRKGYVLSMDKLPPTQQLIVKSVAMAYDGNAESTAAVLQSNGLEVYEDFVEALVRSKGFGDYMSLYGTYGRIPATKQAIMAMWTDVVNDPTAKDSDRMKAAENLARAHGMFKVEVNHSGNVGVDISSILQQVNSNNEIGHETTKAIEAEVYDAEFEYCEEDPTEDEEYDRPAANDEDDTDREPTAWQ